MKKVSIFILLFLLLTGCSNETNSPTNHKKEEDIKTEKETLVEPDYNVEKVRVAVEEGWEKGVVAYKDFNIEVLKEITNKYEIPVDIINTANVEDSLTALKEGKADVALGIYKLDTTSSELLKTTYTYLTSPLYFPNGVEMLEEKDYRFVVNKNNDDLLRLLNDELFIMKDNGKLANIQNEYLGERENKEHVKYEDLLNRKNTNLTEDEINSLLAEIQEFAEKE